MRSFVRAMTVAGISIVLAGAWWGLRQSDATASIESPSPGLARRGSSVGGVHASEVDAVAPAVAALRSAAEFDRGRTAGSAANDDDASPPPRTLSFVVLGPYRVPVPGAVGSFFAWSGDAPLGPRVADTVSGADGTFGMSLPAGQMVVVRVEAAGFTTNEWSMRWPDVDAGWIEVVHLEPVAVRSIEGDLVAPDGRALPQAVLELLRGTGASVDERLDPRESTQLAVATVVFEPSGVGMQDRVTDGVRDVRPRTEIDENGGFAFQRQPVGVAGTLRLVWCGRELSHGTWTGRESRARIVVDPAVLLGGLASLDVVVTGFGGATDFEWLTVLLWSVDGRLAFDRRIARGDSRPLRFARLSPGRYVVEVRARDVLASASSTLEPGEHEVVELDAAPFATLTIDVVGWPTEGAGMPSVLPADGFGPEVVVGARRGEPSGSFVARVPAGRWVVAQNGEARAIDVLAGSTTNVRLAWSASAIVEFELGGELDPNFALAPWVQAWLTVERADGFVVSRDWHELPVDDDGLARLFVPLTPGDYVVRVERNGATVEQAFTVASGDRDQVVRVR